MKESFRLESLVEVLTQAVVCHEPDGSLGAMNAAAERLLQCRREDVVGRMWTEGSWTTVDRDERDVAESQLPGRRSLASKQSISDTLLGIRTAPDARIVWVNANAVFVPSAEASVGTAMVLLEPMVAVTQVHPAAAELDRVSNVPPEQRQFRKRAHTEIRHRALFEQSKCVMLIIHPVTGRILDANQSACEFYGYARESLVRMQIQDINTLAEEAVRSEMKRARSLNTGRFRFRHRLASGELRDVEVFSSPIPIEGEEVLHSIVHDVTKRETAKREIQERNRELRLLNSIITASVQGAQPAELLQMVCSELGAHLQAMEVVAITFEPRPDTATIAAGCVEGVPYSNVGGSIPASRLEGFLERIATGKLWFVDQPEAEPSLSAIVKTLATSPTSLLVLPLVGDKETFGAFVVGSQFDEPFRDHAKREFGQRLAAQVSKALTIARIEQTRRRLLAAIEQSRDIVIITEVDGTVVYSNPAFEAATGKEANWRSGSRVPDVVGAPSLHEAWATVATGRVWVGSFSTTRGDGSRLDADATISPVRDDAGEVVNIIAVARDVTEERQLQRQMQQAQKMEGIGRLAGGLAHDFNNTLAAVMGYAGLVRARLSPDHPAHNDVMEIQETILRASNLSRQLLTFARRQVTEAQPLDLNDVILNLDRMLRRLIGEDIELVTAPAPGLHRTVAERGQTEQVIVNIVVNARDAMPDGGKVVIETENVYRDAEALAGYAGAEPGEYIHLSIRDDGIGMTEEVKQHLFEPFFTTKSAEKGTGLGLATCFGIVGQCGGYIEVDSEVGEGTTVHVYLPATSQQQSIPPSERLTTVLPRGDETVLIAEDDPVVRRMAVRLLDNNGYRVLESSNGEEALRVSARHKGDIHVLLTDVVMPRMGARELIEEIKKQRPSIKVLLMSGYADDTQLRQSAGEQQIPFLGKPFTEMMLMYKIRDLLDR